MTYHKDAIKLLRDIYESSSLGPKLTAAVKRFLDENKT